MTSHQLVREEGKRYGALTVVRRASNIGKAAAWVCRCDCNTEVTVRGDRLRQGRIKTCGRNGHNWRQYKPRGPTLLHPSEYRSWESMWRRCVDKKHPRYKNYGGRGITICKAWESFEQFFRDMGAKPNAKHTIERDKVDGNYEPGNCRWITRKDQGRNMRRSVYVEYEGERMLLMDVVAKIGISRMVVTGRLKMGWSLEDALTLPVRPRKPNRKRKRKVVAGTTEPVVVS